MDDIKDITTIAGKFKNIVELQKYCNEQYELVNTLIQENEDLKLKLKHLEALLGDAVPIIDVIPLSNEEIICIKQLEKLKMKAQNSELTLEEVKKFDLLNKNLKLIRGENTSLQGKGKNPAKNISTSKLIELAKNNK